MKTAILVLLSALHLQSQTFDCDVSTFFQYPINVESGEVKEAGGIAFRAFVWRGFGLEAEAIQSAIEDTFIDRTSLHAVWRTPVAETLGITIAAGAARDWEDSESGVEAGLSLDFSVWKNLELSPGVRWQKDDTDAHIVIPQIGLRWKF